MKQKILEVPIMMSNNNICLISVTGPRVPISNGKGTLDPDAPCNLVYDAATMIDNKLFIFKVNNF